LPDKGTSHPRSAISGVSHLTEAAVHRIRHNRVMNIFSGWHGIDSAILAGDAYEAFALASEVRGGLVNINSPTVNDEIRAPEGGIRKSGWGRSSTDSVADSTEVISLNTVSGQRQLPSKQPPP